MVKRRSLEEAKAARRKRWAEIEARQPPIETAIYALASMVGTIVFIGWSMVAPGLFPSVAVSCCIIVLAALIAFRWRWDDTFK